MDDSRRDFLKKMGMAAGAAGLGLSVPLLRTLASQPGHGKGVKPDKQYAMVVDFEKCLNQNVRRACIEACRTQHNWAMFPKHDRPVRWIWEETFEEAFHDMNHGYLAQRLRGKPVLLMCNHCSKPACVKVCPTKATWKRESDGIVMMDMHRCIGCRFCVVACPYRARSFNWLNPRDYVQGKMNADYPTRMRGMVEKCTFCTERLRDGREPACVEAANKTPGGKGALTFGDQSDPRSELSLLLKENHAVTRLFGLGTSPNVYYIL
ncbi:MAG: sulfate reduction electron transfer complex DsrMKJOP subunit DsrO [Planctomycetota bacterium]